MAHFLIIVTSTPNSNQDALSAIQFAQSAIAQGHRLDTIFFYHDGVLNGNKLIHLASDEPNLEPQWQALSQKGVELVCCVSAALRRGILNKENADEQKLPDNLSSAFRLGGLGELALAMQACDHLIHF